jgi:arylsulfatase A-like enzyme
MSRYMTSGTWRFIAAVFGLQLAFAVSTSAKAAQRNRPNILFLLADDQRFDVPLIIAGPDIPKGKRIDAFVYLFDIFPTLCDVSGIPVPETVEGRSLVPVITSQQATLRKTLFFAYRNIQRAVRDERYKLIEYFVGADGKGTRKTQFFDLAGDPWEMHDLSMDSKHAENLGRLRKEMARWMKEVEDPK